MFERTSNTELSPRDILDNKIRREVGNPILLEGLSKLDRADFLPEGNLDKAYMDSPLTLLPNSSISQPTLVGMMLEHLDLKKGYRVFEIGTATGYEAAWLALAGCIVDTTEVNNEMYHMARKTLDRLSIGNISLFNIDGSEGVEGRGSYDAIVVSATFREVPTRLIEKLREGGTIIAPVGKDPYLQKLIKGKKVDGEMVYEVVDNEVWFYKVISEKQGCWTESLLEKSKLSKLKYCEEMVRIMGDVGIGYALEMIDSLNMKLKEDGTGRKINWENLPEIFCESVMAPDAYYDSELGI